MDNELEDMLNKISKNPDNKIKKQEIVTICNGKTYNKYGEEVPRPVVTLYLGEKYAQFRGEFTQTAPSMKN